MDEARWPAGIRKFIDQAGSQATGPLVIEVEYSDPFWTIKLGCPCCGLVREWHLVGEKPVPVPNAIPIPNSFREVFS